MFITLEETKAWLRVDTDADDTLITGFIAAAEDIVGGILRFPLSELPEVPETLKQAIIFAVSRFYEERESLDIVSLMSSLRGMLFAYRRDAW